jgi:mRNA-degrading endonuclease HigB of HigAB toxin-antitoxin module
MNFYYALALALAHTASLGTHKEYDNVDSTSI